MKQNGVCLFLCLLIVTVASLCLWAPHSHAVETSLQTQKDQQSPQEDNSATHDHSQNEISCCKDLQKVNLKQNLSTTLENVDFSTVEQLHLSTASLLLTQNFREKPTPEFHYGSTLNPAFLYRFLESDPINAPPVG